MIKVLYGYNDKNERAAMNLYDIFGVRYYYHLRNLRYHRKKRLFAVLGSVWEIKGTQQTEEEFYIPNWLRKIKL